MRERQLRLARRRYWFVLLVVVQVAIVVAFVAFNRQCEELIASLSSATGGGAAAGDQPGDAPGDGGAAAGDQPGDAPGDASGEVAAAVAGGSVILLATGLWLYIQFTRKKPALPAGQVPVAPARPAGSTDLVPATLAGRLEAFFKDGKGLFDPGAVRKVEVIENCGSGDCLFLSVEEALEKAGREPKSVAQLRDIVADSMTEAKLGFLKALPADDENYAFVRGVKNLEDLKAKVKSRDYWGDEMALAALSDKLKLRIEVVTAENGIIQRGEQIARDGSQKLKEGIVVLLQDQHYRVLKVNERYIHDLRDSRPAIAA